MKDSLYTLGYAAVLGIVCAALLTGASRFTEPYRKANEQAEEIRNILAVLDPTFDKKQKRSSQDLVDLYKANVRERTLGELDLYEFVPDGKGPVRSVAVPVEGPGLWGPIEGFLSLDPDMTVIRGITFHRQEETPGLGGEIGSDWFAAQFKGKRIVSPDGRPGMKIVRDATRPNEVDAITGATMTCNKVEAMLNDTIDRVVKEAGGHGE